MTYSLVLKEEIEKDLSKLSSSQKLLVYKQFKKLQTSPELGQPLGNKNNLHLTGLKKMYFDGKRYRVVYEVVESEVLVYIIAIGKRDKMEVHEKAGERRWNM